MPRRASAVRNLLAGVAVATVALTGCSSTPHPTAAHPSAAPTHATKSSHKTHNSHLVSVDATPDRITKWAELVFAAHTFDKAITRSYLKHHTFTFPGTPEDVATAVGYISPLGQLDAYAPLGSGYRYCLHAVGGTFYAATVIRGGTPKQRQITVFGTGGCNYQQGAIYTTPGHAYNASLLDSIQNQYLTMRSNGIPYSGDVFAIINGSNIALKNAATASGRALAAYTTKHNGQPLTLTPAIRSALHLRYRAPIRLGYYDNRRMAGWRLCLTDGHEEAIFEDLPDHTPHLLRDAAGTCRAG